MKNIKIYDIIKQEKESNKNAVGRKVRAGLSTPQVNMKIVIAGFDNVREAVGAVNEWVEKNQIYLFYIVCNKGSLAEAVAETLGAPAYFLNENDVESLVQKLPKIADYGIIKYDGNNFVRRLIMGLRAEGKHGWVIKT